MERAEFKWSEEAAGAGKRGEGALSAGMTILMGGSKYKTQKRLGVVGSVAGVR